MTDRIAVVPAAPAYVGKIKHPIDGPLKESGTQWSYDGFTCRMLTEGVVFRTPAEAPAPAGPAAPAPAAPLAEQAAPAA